MDKYAEDDTKKWNKNMKVVKKFTKKCVAYFMWTCVYVRAPCSLQPPGDTH